MASLGKAINKKSFYGSEGLAEIAMPPLDEASPITTAAPDPWSSQSQPQEQHGLPSVPDSVPEEYLADTNDDQAEEIEEESPKQRVDNSQKDSSIAANMRALRESKEKAERERDEMMRLLQMQAQMQQSHQKQEEHNHEPEPEVDDFADLDPDALVDGKYLNKLSKQQKLQRAEMRSLKEELNKYKSQSNETMVESRIKAQFPDFDKVVSRENVDVLNEQFPELARTLRDTTDTYAKAVSAYKVIKQFGIHKEEVVDPDRARAIRNSNKPRPLASVNPQQGDSPLSKANAFANGEFTKEMKQQSWREMQAAMKNNR